MTKNKNVSLQACVIVSLAALYYLYSFFIRVLPSVMTRDLMAGFNASGVQISTLMVAFVYAYGLSQIPSGILIDKYGAKRVLIFGMLGCYIGGSIFQSTSNLCVAIFARVILGFCSGPAFIAPMTLVKKNFPKKLFTPAAGFIQTLGCVGAMLTKPASDLVAQVGWKEAIEYSTLMSIALFILYCLFPNDSKTHIDQNQISTSKALSYITHNSSFWLVGFLALASWAPVGGFAEAWGVSYLSVLQNISISQATSQMSWAWIGVAISSPLAGFWFEHTEYKAIPLMTMYAFGLISIILLITSQINNPHIIAFLLFILGASAGAQPIAFKLVSRISPDNIHATAVSFCNMCVIAGAFIVQPIVSQVLEMAWDGHKINNIPYYQAQHFQISFIPIAIIVTLAMIVTLSIHKLESKDEVS